MLQEEVMQNPADERLPEDNQNANLEAGIANSLTQFAVATEVDAPEAFPANAEVKGDRETGETTSTAGDAEPNQSNVFGCAEHIWNRRRD